MQAKKATLQEILNSPNQYVIPVFQRYYVWGEDQWEPLWANILELISPDHNLKTHFMGSLVVAEEAREIRGATFQVIDGQQRMITLSLLLCALRDVAIAQGIDDIAGEIDQYFLFHKSRKGSDQYRVFPRQYDRDHFLSALNREAIPEGKIEQARAYFIKEIETCIKQYTDPIEQLYNLTELVKSGLEFVFIALDGENPYRIFKSLNSLGIDLEESDLIRNFIFMHVPSEDQTTFDAQHWARLEQHFLDQKGKVNSRSLTVFCRDFLMQKGSYVPLDSIYDSFERTYQKNLQPLVVTKTLTQQANLYDLVRGVKAYSNAQTQHSLEKLRALDSSTTYPLLLNLSNRVEQNTLAIEDFNTITELLAGFILRRYICGESSRAYGRWFVALCKSLEEKPTSLPTDIVRKFLIDKFFPDNSLFKQRIITFRMYGSNYSDAILKALERAQGHKESVDLSGVTTEHIMPRTLTSEWRQELGTDPEITHKEWLDTIGNLTLSGYNAEMSNRPFQKKKEWYSQSNLVLNRQIADQSEWTLVQIKDRADKLGTQATKIWIGTS